MLQLEVTLMIPRARPVAVVEQEERGSDDWNRIEGQ